ncbi:MAG: hypothetical protein ACK449_16130 [Planctomycetota bacterium]
MIRSIQAVILSALFAVACLVVHGGDLITSDKDRSPVDLVLSDTDSWLATANQTSNSVSLINISDGKLLDEALIGEHPTGIVLHPWSGQLLVTASYSGELYFLSVHEGRLKIESKILLGFQPTGLAVSPDGKSIYVALTDADQVAVVDFASGSLVRKINVGRWPRTLAVSNDGSRLAVGTSGDRGVSIVDAIDGRLLHIDQFIGLNIGHMQTSKRTDEVYFPWMVYRRNPINDGNIRLGWVMASRLGRIGFTDSAHRQAISLDPPGKAVADPHGLALTHDEKSIVISASGTQELLVFKQEGLPFQDRGSTDHIDRELLNSPDRFYRIELGGRPMGLRIAKDDRTVWVANYIGNSVQAIDLIDRRIVRSIFLGGNQTPSLARRGEAIFYDAKRSLDQWYSCHSCHYLGGSNAVAIDTVNDGSAYTFKSVLPLFQLNQTGPWTWHGWQVDLVDAMKHSLKTTMAGPNPTHEDALAIAEYVSKLQPPPNPYRTATGELSPSAKRGREIFIGKEGGCIDCHHGSMHTDSQVHDLGLGSTADAYKGYNTPTLKGVFRKVELLHDGRASSLEEVLSGDHAPEKVNGQAISKEQKADLIEYLKTL